MTKLLLLVIPVFIYAQSLKSLLDFATTNNKMAISKDLQEMAREKEVESSKSEYYPKIDAGAFYSRDDDRSKNIPGDTYSGYAKISLDLYSGGETQNTIKQNKELSLSAKYNSLSYKKSLQLSITEDYYNIKSDEATLNALKDKELQLLAELDRVKKFYDVGSATIDEIDRLKAEYSDNLYQIDQVKYQIISLKKLLSIKIGKRVDSIADAFIEEPKDITKDISDTILALKSSASALKYGANVISSANMPQVKIEDTYSLYGYERYDKTHPEGLENQNKLMLTLNMRLFDMGVITKQKEALLLEEKALQSEVEYAINEQDVNVELAMLKIGTTKAQIKSAKSSLESAESAYNTISEKYEVGSVDNVTYLDALSVRTNAKSQYERALNNLQISYASYYYHTNKNIKEYIK